MTTIKDIVLSCKSLSAGYSSKSILKGIGFDVSKGDWLGIIGPNGCGKTTLLKCINDALDFKGEIKFLGKSLSSFSSRELARSMAFLRQNPGMWFSLTAREVASLGLLPHKGYLNRNSEEENQIVEKLFRDLDLESLLDRNMEQMSGGEQRMVFLAQAILQDPELLLLDEPTVHLDPGRQFGFLNKVEELRMEGVSVVSVFHDINLACRYVSQIMIMRDGQLFAYGNPRDVLVPENVKVVFGINAEIGEGRDGKLSVMIYP